MPTDQQTALMPESVSMVRARSIWAFGVGSALATALLLSVGSRGALAAADWSNAQLVTVVMTEYRFEPSVLSFRRGVPYRLHLENRGAELHEFTAEAFFHAVEIGNPEILAQEGREVELQPGAQKDVLLIPRQAGRYGLICADHDYYGMVGEITIE
jgi:uncharacterized cupredoxin-like copper-binding protein